MTNNKKLASFFLAVLVLFALMTSLFVISSEADHECIGDHCRICEVIAICHGVIKVLGTVLTAAAALFACCFTALYIIFSRFIAYCETPVLLKVKLLN